MMLIIAILLMGIIAARWPWVAGGLLAYILFVRIVAMIIHSRNAAVKIVQTSPKKYGRKQQHD